jgi:DNA-binding XRE family transcriptional regulator
MPNLAATLKAEISRLARKEVRAETESLRKTVAALRVDLQTTKKKLRELEAQSRKPSRARPAPTTSAEVEPSSPDARFRFSAKGLASNRKRLGLSADDFGRLVGATGQAVAGWERGANKPREKYLPAIAELRGIGKREVAKRLNAART